MPAKMKIRSAYATLPSAERKVADFILENSERATRMVINEIAEAAGVSVPSVTRLARKLGYSGFLDFRVALASGTANMETRKNTDIIQNIPVTNSKIAAMPYGIIIHKIQALDLPCLEWVRSTRCPIRTSEKPSKNRDTNMMVPIIAAEIPTTLV